MTHWFTLVHSFMFFSFILFFGKEGGNESMTVVESTHHAHVKNFDLVVPLLPHPLLVRSGAALLHCLLTWKNSSVEPHTHTPQCYSMAKVRCTCGLTWATKAPNFIMYDTEERIIPISPIIHKIEYYIAFFFFTKTVTAVTLFLAFCTLFGLVSHGTYL